MKKNITTPTGFMMIVFILMAVLSGCGSGGTAEDPKPTIIPADNTKNNNTEKTDIDNPITDQVQDMPDNQATEIEPVTPDNETETLIPDNETEPVILVLDPGHGGIFSGAINGEIVEKDVTLKLALFLKDYLLENYSGIEVFLTRESDVELDNDIVTELEKRAEFAKEKDADYFVSLHFNASEAHTSNGATIYASVSRNVSDLSQELGNAVLTHLVGLGLKDNGVQTRNSSDHFAEDGSPLDYYAVLRHNAAREIPAVIVEHCFMDNTEDLGFMNSNDKLKKLAEADAMGIAEFLKLEKK